MGYGGNAGAESEAFKGLVKGYGEEEDEEGAACCDGEGHADEDGVEEDAGFEEETLEEEVLLGVGLGRRGGSNRVWGGIFKVE